MRGVVMLVIVCCQSGDAVHGVVMLVTVMLSEWRCCAWCCDAGDCDAVRVEMLCLVL